MSDNPPVDLDVVAGWIDEAGAGPVRRPLSAQRIGNGQSNLTYLLTDTDTTGHGRRWVKTEVMRPG